MTFSPQGAFSDVSRFWAKYVTPKAPWPNSLGSCNSISHFSIFCQKKTWWNGTWNGMKLYTRQLPLKDVYRSQKKYTKSTRLWFNANDQIPNVAMKLYWWKKFCTSWDWCNPIQFFNRKKIKVWYSAYQLVHHVSFLTPTPVGTCVEQPASCPDTHPCPGMENLDSVNQVGFDVIIWWRKPII